MPSTLRSLFLSPPPLAPVRTVSPWRALRWLTLGARDLLQVPGLGLAHGLVLALIGALILTVGHNRFWLMAGALSGFLIVGPVVATSLYAISRALERGERVDRALVRRTWLGQHGAGAGDPARYWPLLRFGLLLSLAATGWVVVSAALITVLSPVPIDTPRDFLQHVMLARQGQLFAWWLALGSFLAAPIFASSVVAMPLLLDRRVSVRQAVLTSWAVVLANPVPMALWAALIVFLTLLGLASLLAGLVVVMPVLGHASWHAYRDLVDASAFPPR